MLAHHQVTDSRKLIRDRAMMPTPQPGETRMVGAGLLFFSFFLLQEFFFFWLLHFIFCYHVCKCTTCMSSVLYFQKYYMKKWCSLNGSSIFHNYSYLQSDILNGKFWESINIITYVWWNLVPSHLRQWIILFQFIQNSYATCLPSWHLLATLAIRPCVLATQYFCSSITQWLQCTGVEKLVIRMCPREATMCFL